MQFETGTGTPSGFAFVNETGFRSNAPAPAGATSTSSTASYYYYDDHDHHSTTGSGQSTAPGVIRAIRHDQPVQLRQQCDRDGGSSPARDHCFALYPHRRAAGQPDRDYEPDGFRRHHPAVELRRRGRAAQITSVVNAGDRGTDIAPGGLISVFGTQLSPVNMATSEIPLPTALANSCLSVNGLPVPILFVSPNQVNAQMPYQAIGDVTLILRTPGGQSDNYNLVIEPNAPSVFMATVGPDTNVPTVVRRRRQRTGDPVASDSPEIEHSTDHLPHRPGSNFARCRDRPAGAFQPAGHHADSADRDARRGRAYRCSFSGLAPGLVGVDQINVSVPFYCPRRNVCPPRDHPGIGFDFDPGASGGLTANLNENLE